MPLTLTRKPREAVILRIPAVGGGYATAKVSVTWIDRNTARLTFDAPDFEICREELLSDEEKRNGWLKAKREEAP